MRYSFANCVLDTDRHQLVRDGVTIKTEPQVFDLLHLLVRHAGDLVTRDQIIDEVWGGRIVSESAISARINAARTAVGDTGASQAIIKTVTRRGLQFVAPILPSEAVAAPMQDGGQRVRYATSKDGTKIAHATTGSGRKIMRAGHFLTHLEMDWSSVVWRPYLDALGKDHTLVRFDQRGTGLSDRDAQDLGLAAQVQDLASVADAVGLDRFPIFAMSQGVPVAIRFAVDHPDRVACLVLYGGYAEGRALRDGGQSKESAQAMIAMMQEGWGKPESAFMAAFTSLFCPEASREQLADLVEMQLASTDADRAPGVRMAIDRFTVLDQLANVNVPTLVIHSKGDSVHPYSEGQKLASGIPGADFLTLESVNHILLPDDPAWSEMMKATLEFIDQH